VGPTKEVGEKSKEAALALLKEIIEMPISDRRL
jgi:hypothetical protein